MNKIKVLFFATLRDKTGTKAIELEIPAGMTIGQAKEMLIGQYPKLNGFMQTSLATINFEYRFDEIEIPQNAEIAFFPPVSGG